MAHLPDQPNNILIIKLGAFGDVLIAQETIRVLRQRHPGARITALTAPPFATIMRRNPAIDHTITASRKHRLLFWHLLGTRRLLKAGRYDRVYDLQASKRTRLYRRWLGQDVPWFSGMRPVLGEGVPWISDRAIGWLAEPVDRILADNGIDRPFIFLVPGCSANNAYKRWPYFAELADRLSDAGHLCVTAPGPGEIDVCRPLNAKMLMAPGPGGRPGPLSIPQLAGVVKQAAFAIGNDTGPTHLCALSGTPGVAIFGPFTPPQQVGIDQLWPIIEAEQLDRLPAQEVLDRVLGALARPEALTPS